MLDRQATAEPTARKPTQAKKRCKNRSPTPRANHGQRHVGSSIHQITKSTTAISAPIYEIAKFVADRRTRTSGDSGLHVDAIAADFATTNRFRELNLLHSFASDRQRFVQHDGRNIHELPPRCTAKSQPQSCPVGSIGNDVVGRCSFAAKDTGAGIWDWLEYDFSACPECTG